MTGPIISVDNVHKSYSVRGLMIAIAFNIAEERPQQLALDTTLASFVIAMATLASVLGTVFSAQRIVRRKVVDILRIS